LQKGNPESGLFSVKARATLHFFSKKLGIFFHSFSKPYFFSKKLSNFPSNILKNLVTNSFLNLHCSNITGLVSHQVEMYNSEPRYAQKPAL